MAIHIVDIANSKMRTLQSVSISIATATQRKRSRATTDLH